MAIPKLREVVNATFATDGGSIRLRLLDDADSNHTLELVQHLVPANSTVDRKIGRLYFDDRLIDVRSSDETAIISFLQTAPVRSGYEKGVEEVLAFVRLDEYVQLVRVLTSRYGSEQ